MDTLQARVKAMITDRFGVPAEAVTAEATLEELSLDSLILAEFTLILRRELGVTLEDWELETEMTVADMVAVLEQKGAAA